MAYIVGSFSSNPIPLRIALSATDTDLGVEWAPKGSQYRYPKPTSNSLSNSGFSGRDFSPAK